MRTLYFKATGDDVRKWEFFLRGLYPELNIIADGSFDSRTLDATKRFQRDCGLTADGVVGPKTLSKALEQGYDIMTDDRADEDGPNWPPQTLPPLTFGDKQKLFGSFSYKPSPSPGNPEGIEISGTWVKDNIVSVKVPELQGRIVSVNKKIVTQFLRAFAGWDSSGLIDRVLTFDGAFAPRFVRGSRMYLSNHSLGTAFDINAQWNGLGVVPALKGQRGSVRELVHIANECGFAWGGHFKDRSDGMHFEAAKIIT